MIKARKAKLGMIQVTADYSWSVEKCIEEMLFLAEKCLKEGVDLVFMPEVFQYKTAHSTLTIKELAQKYSQNYKEKCSNLAKKYRAYIVPWDYEIDKKGNIYNSSYILDRCGKEMGRYRKVQITYPEMKWRIKRGNNFPVFKLDFGKIGIMICFDNYFPESAEILGLEGAELILYPLHGDTMLKQWEIKLKARAIDNTLYVASSSITIGYSKMVDPDGEIICSLENPGTYKVIEIELGKKKITNTSARNGNSEDIKKYLLNSRNVRAYYPITKKRLIIEWKKVLNWKDI